MTPSKTNRNRDELLKFLQATDLFKGLDRVAWDEVAARMEAVELEEGQALFHQGDPGDDLYVVVSGLLQVTTEDRTGRRVFLGEVEPGQPVGEMQLLSGGPRRASVHAAARTELVKLPQAVVKRLLARRPELERRFREIVRTRLRRNQLAVVLTGLFGSLNETNLRMVETEAERVHLARGQTLFHEGEPGDDLYLLVSGRLQATTRHETGAEIRLGEMAPGEIIGEMAVFSGEPRSATVRAIRESELVRFSKPVFERIFAQNPSLAVSVIQLLISRLRRSISGPGVIPEAVNLAVIPITPDAPWPGFAERLVESLAVFGPTLHLNSRRLDGLMGAGVAQCEDDDPLAVGLTSWCDEQEARHRFVVYEADPELSPWTRRCVRHADRILLVGRASADPQPGRLEEELFGRDDSEAAPSLSLVLIHPDGRKTPAETRLWLVLRPRVENHFHLRWGEEADFGRLARFLAGRSVGVVLSGGGVRGFAHLGVLRALGEAGVPVDMIGGASMGAVVAGLYALDQDCDKVAAKIQADMAAEKPFSEYTLPIFSLVRGRRLNNLIRKYSGDVFIEDLWLSFFCVSSDLTSAQVRVHRSGAVWKAIRASVALPGITPPWIEGGNILVDGGVLNNLPADVMRELGCGLMIVVDVNEESRFKSGQRRVPSPWSATFNRLAPFKQRPDFPNIFDILSRTALLSSLSRAERAKTMADLYLRPPVDEFKMLDFERLSEIAEIGYRYSKPIIERWLVSSGREKIGLSKPRPAS